MTSGQRPRLQPQAGERGETPTSTVVLARANGEPGHQCAGRISELRHRHERPRALRGSLLRLPRPPGAGKALLRSAQIRLRLGRKLGFGMAVEHEQVVGQEKAGGDPVLRRVARPAVGGVVSAHIAIARRWVESMEVARRWLAARVANRRVSSAAARRAAAGGHCGSRSPKRTQNGPESIRAR